jgi:hypothetical protein
VTDTADTATQTRVFLTVDRDGLTGRLQVSIGDRDAHGAGTGHRLLGPKYLGSSSSLAETEIDAYDAAGILGYVLPVMEAWLARREAEGFTVDRSSWPWRVFKGDRDNPSEWRQLGVAD